MEEGGGGGYAGAYMKETEWRWVDAEDAGVVLYEGYDVHVVLRTR